MIIRSYLPWITLSVCGGKLIDNPIGDTENPTVDSQREWVKRRNTCASDQICILAYYKSRIEEFGFGTVGIFDHAKGKPEFFLYSELFYAYQSSGFLYRFTNAERKAGQAKLENPAIIIPDLRYLEKINSCNKNSIKAEVLLVKATFKDVLGVNLSNNGQVMKRNWHPCKVGGTRPIKVRQCVIA